jgi:hypothetical protein
VAGAARHGRHALLQGAKCSTAWSYRASSAATECGAGLPSARRCRAPSMSCSSGSGAAHRPCGRCP